MKLELMFEAIVITNTTFDLCDKVKEYGLECPLSAKTYNFEMKFLIPNGLPEVSFPILCIKYLNQVLKTIVQVCI